MFKILKLGAKNLILRFFSIIFLFIVFVFPAQANVVFNSPSSYNNVTDLTTRVVNWFLSITAGVAVLFLIIGGIYYVTAFGDEHRLEEAKKIITYTIYGLIIVLISYSVVLTINNIIFE